MRRLACSGLLLLLCLCQALPWARCQDAEGSDATDDEYEEPVEKAFLVVQKKISEKDIILGRNMTVVVSIYNAGNSAALDVSVEDPAWQEEYFSPLSGEPKAAYPRIAAGASVELKYVVQPLNGAEQNQFVGQPAVVQYRPETDSQDVQLAFSTTPLFIVLSKYQTYIRSLLTVGSWATGGALTHPSHWTRFLYVIGILGVVGGGSWLFTAFRDATKRRRYQKAYAEVSKYD